MPTTKTCRALATATTAAVLLIGAPAALAQSPCGPTTTVQPGDTFFLISQRCDVPLSQIRAANPGVDAQTLEVGQALQLEVEQTPDRGSAGDRYRVREGETLASIAERFGLNVDALRKANPDLEPGLLEAGQELLLPGFDGAPTVPGENGQRTGGPRPVEVTGVLTNEGVECQAMRSRDWQLYTLTGDLEDFAPGDVVRVDGVLPNISHCMQGTTIRVEQITGAE